MIQSDICSSPDGYPCKNKVEHEIKTKSDTMVATWYVCKRHARSLLDEMLEKNVEVIGIDTATYYETY